MIGYATPCEINFKSSSIVHEHFSSLTREERDQIWMQIHFAVHRMNQFVEHSDREASRITDFNIRDITKSIIQGCICGLAGRSPHSIVISGALNALAHIGGEAYDHFQECRHYLQEAEFYAQEADRLQERLWRDE